MIALLVVLEVCLGVNGVDQSLLVRRRGTNNSLSDFLPSSGLLAAVLVLILQEVNVDKALDKLREACVSQSTTSSVLATGTSRMRVISSTYRTMVWASGML